MKQNYPCSQLIFLLGFLVFFLSAYKGKQPLFRLQILSLVFQLYCFYWYQVNMKLIAIKMHTVIPRATRKKKLGKSSYYKIALQALLRSGTTKLIQQSSKFHIFFSTAKQLSQTRRRLTGIKHSARQMPWNNNETRELKTLVK